VTVTTPASAFDYLTAVANGQAKAAGLKRPTASALQQAAKALGLSDRVDHAPYGYHVGKGWDVSPCPNLKAAASALLAAFNRTPAQALPKAAQAILELPGVESLEREGADWCCHLRFGWTTEALGGGGTIIDSNLQTILAYVRGAYALPPAPAPAAAPAPELTSLPLIRKIHAAAPAPLSPAPELPAFVTYQQQQQQPQQAPAEFKLPPATKYDAPCPIKAPAPTCLAPVGPAPVVAAGPRSRATAPSHLPEEGARLLQRFELGFDSVLTTGLANTKIGKGAALAHSAIFHGLPAKQLETAVYGAMDAPVAARGRLETVRQLALVNGLGALVQSLNACPWASAGCRDGCLVFSGRNAMGTAPAACKARRSLARLFAPSVFGVVLLWAIAREYARAQRMGLPLSLRLKGTDDLPHHLQRFNLHQDEAAILARRYGLPAIPGWGTTLPEILQIALGDGSIKWYEYSKAPLGGSQGLLELQGCGIDVTASLAADRRGGARAATGAVRAGLRLAVPLDIKRGAAIPSELLLAPTLGLPAPYGSPEFGRVPADDKPVRLLCIDGDKTDLRWLDPQGPQPGGFDGVAVILRTKRSRGRGAAAAAFSLQPSADWQALKGGGFAKLGPC
jgi:hypothetical protein